MNFFSSNHGRQARIHQGYFDHPLRRWFLKQFNCLLRHLFSQDDLKYGSAQKCAGRPKKNVISKRRLLGFQTLFFEFINLLGIPHLFKRLSHLLRSQHPRFDCCVNQVLMVKRFPLVPFLPIDPT